MRVVRILSCVLWTLAAVSGAYAAADPYAYKKTVQTRRAPVAITTNAAGCVVADFGRAAFGFLEFVPPAGVRGAYRVRLGERLTAGGRVDMTPGATIRAVEVESRISAEGVCRVPLVPDPRNTRGGREGGAIAIPPEHGVVMPFRYAEVVSAPFPVTPSVVRQVIVHYPMDLTASSFTCSNPDLVKIYDFCKYSIFATSFAGLYVDGDRERIPYEADAYLNQLGEYVVHADYSLARASHEYLMAHPTWPTEWKQHSIKMAWADWMWSGDTRSAAKCYDRLRDEKLLLNFARPSDGLLLTGGERLRNSLTNRVGAADIVDWPPAERDGFVFTDVNAVVNAFHYRNLLEMADLARALGKASDAEAFTARARRVHAAFNAVFFDTGRGVYRDGEGTDHASLHANVAALAFGLVPPAHRASVAAFCAARGMACSVYFAQYLLEALFEADEADAAIRLMTSGGDRSWLGMLDQGATMTMEAWAVKYKPNLDLNHAWGAAPLNVVSRYVLGVTPLEPGFRKIRIRPQIGSLVRVAGRVPTAQGPVDVAVAHGTLTVTTPAPARIEFAGVVRDVPAGRHEIAASKPSATVERRWPLAGTFAELNGGCPFHASDSRGEGLDTNKVSFVVDGGRPVLRLRDGGVCRVNDDPRYDLVPGLRLSCRVKFDTLDPAPGHGWQTVVGKGHIMSRGAFLLRVNPSAEDGRFGFFLNFGDRPEPRVVSKAPVKAGVWYDLATGWDGTNAWLTVNGETTRVRRTGPVSGCLAPLVVGAFDGCLSDFSISSSVPSTPPDAAETHLAQVFRLAGAVTFDELPSGETTLLSRPNEFLLRYDVRKGDPPGQGYFGFWVFLNGGWEPRTSVTLPIELGRRYNVAASWDGLATSLHVDGLCDTQTRSGRVVPSAVPMRKGAFKGRIDDVSVRVQKIARLQLDDCRTVELLPRAGRNVTLKGALSVNGSLPVSNAHVVVQTPPGVSVVPAAFDLPALDLGGRHPFTLVVEPGTNRVFDVCLKATASDGYELGTFNQNVVVMPAEDPDFSAAAWNPPVRPTKTYHVDAAHGDDARDGLSPATAWRTFARAKVLVLGPGERLLLRRGSTFNEELTLRAKGAADNWAEIGAYGEGARPTIRRNRFIGDRCARIFSDGHLVVRDLVVCNAGKGLGVECSPTNAGGLLVERCLAHHIEGLYRFNAHGIPEWRDHPGPLHGPRGGIGIGGTVRGAVLRDCEMYQCSAGFAVVGRDVCVQRVFCHDNACHNTSPHPFMTSTDCAWLLDSIFDASGWNASAGTMGIMLARNDGYVIRNCHFLNQPDSGSHDEGGVDFEAQGQNCLIDRCTFRNNAGAAIEVLGLVAPQAKNTHITRSRFDRNNVALKLGPSEIFIWGGTKDPQIVCSNGRIDGNGYVLHPGVCFYTNQAERTRADWTVTNNVQYASAAELDRALPWNNPPQVSAGDEIWTDDPRVGLAGVCSDDALPTPAAPAVAWELLEGPGTVAFADARSARTTATFAQTGDYRLLLKADDGEHWRTARTAVHVLPKGARVVRAWNFARNHDAEGWTFEGLGTTKEFFKAAKSFWSTFANPVHLVCGDYFVLAIKDAPQPRLFSPDNLGLALDGTQSLVLRLQNHTDSKRMRLSFTTEQNPDWAQTRTCAFAVVPNDEADTIYRIPLPGTGVVKQFRLDFSADGTPVRGTCRIDYIWFGRLP